MRSIFPYGKMILVDHDIHDIDALGALVREQRKRQGMTQAELGELCNVGPRFVGELERGKATVQFDKVLAVISVLGIRLRVQTVEEDRRDD